MCRTRTSVKIIAAFECSFSLYIIIYNDTSQLSQHWLTSGKLIIKWCLINQPAMSIFDTKDWRWIYFETLKWSDTKRERIFTLKQIHVYSSVHWYYSLGLLIIFYWMCYRSESYSWPFLICIFIFLANEYVSNWFSVYYFYFFYFNDYSEINHIIICMQHIIKY